MAFLGKFLKKKRVFLDFASVTPVDPEVLGVMDEVTRKFSANPSALYSEALLAKEKVSEAREKIAGLLNTQKDRIFFTSGGTEGNNMALLGVFESFKKDNFVPHFITTKIEHPSVLEVCREIERRGGEVTYLEVSEDGIVNPKDIREALKDNTVLVSVMYANNEIGTVEPIKEIGKIIKDYRNKNKKDFPYFHTDACQVGLYLSLDTLHLNVDLLTLDGIKIYGPRGTGVLFVKTGVEISPIVFGGGQESSFRSGTENTPGIVGLAKALEKADRMKLAESERLYIIRDYMIDKILETFPNSKLNGSRDNRLPNNVNICFPGLDAEFAVISLDVLGFAVSYSSSCRTLKEDSSSYVIENIGRGECKESSLRFTFGRETNKKDIDSLISALKKVVLS